MKMKAVFAAFALAVAAPASAATVTYGVDAMTADINGAGMVTDFTFAAGDSFSVTVLDPADTWSLGDGGFEFLADGTEVATGDPYGAFYFDLFGGKTFNYGTLVGRVGSGDFFAIGLGGVFTAAVDGTLALFNWDTVYGDNSGLLKVEVADVASPVPLPAGGLMLISALGLAGVAARRGRKAA